MIPNWFVKLVCGVIFLAAPFIVWVTVTLLQVQFAVTQLMSTNAGMIAQVNSDHDALVKLAAQVDRIAERLIATETSSKEVKQEQQRRTKNIYAIEKLEDDIAQIKEDLKRIADKLGP